MEEIGELTEEERKRIYFVDDYKKINLEDSDIHMLCLPTEKNFKPCREYLENVIENIAMSGAKNILIIIESSMAPRYIKESIINILEKFGLKEYENYLLGIAPRRDLFGNSKFNLKSTPRVISGNGEHAKTVVKEFYSIFCDELIEAKDCYHAALSKIVENTYRCFNISLANILAVSLKEFDITHVLELASTKWNVEKYHPSFGVGGYCIPLAPQYIKEQMEVNGLDCPIIDEFLNFNSNSVDFILENYARKFHETNNILVLGLSSIPNVGILNCSIGVLIVKKLKNRIQNIAVNDNFITEESLVKITNCVVQKDLNDLSCYDGIFIITQHEYYKKYLDKIKLKPGCIIIDSFGIWNKLKSNTNYQYYEVGRNIEFV